MRRGPAAAMSALTVVVLGVSLRASGLDGVPSASPPGVVLATVTPAATPRPSRSPGAGDPTGRGRGPRLVSRSPSPTPAAPTRPAAVTQRPAPRTTTAAPRSTPTTSRPLPRTTTRPPPPPTPAPPATAARVNGQAIDTRYGLVQVQVVIKGGRITGADAIDYPQGSSRDREINSSAVPQLDDEVLAAQSATIDTVSGATYTSDGYRRSLQSALDAAHSAGLL